MGRQNKKGFTIIEIMLVIAISGLMIYGVFANSSRQVSERQYREGVQTFRDFIAQQFEDVKNLKNDNDRLRDLRKFGCGVATGADRGTSNCVYSGKLILIYNDEQNENTNLESYPIISNVREPYIDKFGKSQDGEVNATYIHEDGLNVTKTKSDWNTLAFLNRVGEPVYLNSSSSVKKIALIILRDPFNGFVYSYSGVDSKANVSAFNDDIKSILSNPRPTVSGEPVVKTQPDLSLNNKPSLKFGDKIINYY